MAVLLTFDYANFVANPTFAAYTNATLYPEATLQLYWDNAINYVSNVTTAGQLTEEGRRLAINLMVAHLVYISGLAASGQVPSLMQNATIDKVQIALTPPPLKNQWQWWLSVSPYGQQLFALLQANSVGGRYIGLNGTGLAGFGFVPGYNFNGN